MSSPSGSSPAPPVRRHLHPWRLALGLSFSLVVLGFGVVSIRYTFREHPGPKSVSSAVNNFRGQGPSGANDVLRYRAPPEGVYELKGQGTERISFPPNSQNDGRSMPGSVTYLDGCWRWHLDYNVAHWEEYDFCPNRTQLMLRANRNSQSWDFGFAKVNNLAQFSCPAGAVLLPENPAPGQALEWRCSGTNSAVPGPTTTATSARIIGTETLHIAGSAVAAIHQHQRITLSGGQRGTVVEDWWFEAETGLPVRMARNITISSASPVGNITYNEVGSWEMTSLRPRT